MHNSDSGIREIFACGIRNPGMRNTAQRIRTPWRGIQNPRLSLGRLSINGNGTLAPFAIKFTVCVM